MWWILHRQIPGVKVGGRPDFILTSTCPHLFRDAMKKILTPDEIDNLDSPDSKYKIIITNWVPKIVVGLDQKKETPKEDLK